MRLSAAMFVRVSCGILATACIPPELGAQEGCRYADDGNDVLQAITTPQGGRVTYITNPHFLCEDGVEIWADSAVAYSEQAMSHLIGAVRYLDRTRELRAREARYFTEVGRLQAQGNVRVTNTDDGTVIENGDLVYLRETDFRDEEEMTVTTGPDGIRPKVLVRPAPPDSMPDAEPGLPYTVEGDRIVLRGSAAFVSTGDVRIERDSLLAFGDSAEYQEPPEELVLVGSARVESGTYTLVGRTITIGTAASDTSEIHARRDALLTGDDIVVNAPHITLHVADGAVERLVAVPLPSADAEQEPEADSADAARPVALAETFELTADSLELIAPADVVERIVAVGAARSVSRARDSLNVASLPEIARTDWLEGDTVVISLKQVADTTLGATSESEYEVERIVARVGARSLYRLPPEDSTAALGVDPPAVHYVVGDEITLVMEAGEVQSMEVVGQTRGVHLEPLSGPSDSLAAAPDSASANDFSLADFDGRSPTPPGGLSPAGEALHNSGGPRCGATAPDPRRRESGPPRNACVSWGEGEGIAVATSRSVNDGDGAVPPQPTNMLQIFNWVGAQGDRGPGGRRSSSPYGPVRLVARTPRNLRFVGTPGAPTPDLASPLRAGHQNCAELPQGQRPWNRH